MSSSDRQKPQPPKKPRLTEEDGKRALRDHVVDRALLAREKYGDPCDHETLLRLLDDREVVRYPVTVEFDATPLEPGEFAYAAPIGERPSEGYRLCVHPHFRGRHSAVPLLVAYHLVRVNYGDIATREEAELFGAALLGIEVNDYYEALCRLADELLPAAAGSCEGTGCRP